MRRTSRREPGRRRAELEARVAARTEELSTLSTHLLRLMETERSELAKELHDELGGLITAAKMDMSWLSARIGGSLDAESREKFDSVMQMLNQAMMLKRRVVEDLRPSLLDHFGLAVALRSHFDEHCARAGIECVATLPDETLELDAGGAAHACSASRRRRWRTSRARRRQARRTGHRAGGRGLLMMIGDDGARRWTPDLARSMPSVRHRMQCGRRQCSTSKRAPGQGNRIRAFVPRSAAGSA